MSTASPSKSPTAAPTKLPTLSPSKSPTVAPTKAPTKTPSKSPSFSPTMPTTSPTLSPTLSPTYYCHYQQDVVVLGWFSFAMIWVSIFLVAVLMGFPRLRRKAMLTAGLTTGCGVGCWIAGMVLNKCRGDIEKTQTLVLNPIVVIVMGLFIIVCIGQALAERKRREVAAAEAESAGSSRSSLTSGSFKR